MAGTADANIIYSGVQNLSVEINSAAVTAGSLFSTYKSVSIDIDGGGADLFAGVGFGAINSGATAWKYVGAAVVGGTGSALLLGTSPFGGGANLVSGALIGPSASFSTLSASRYRVSSSTPIYGPSSSSSGNFAISQNGIVGIRLSSGNFGWVRLHIGDLGLNQPFASHFGSGAGFPDQVTLVDWAYQSNGNSIRAGQTVSEPSSLALLAIGAAGIGAFRQRKTKRQSAAGGQPAH